MRMTAKVSGEVRADLADNFVVKRLMIYEVPAGDVYLFLYAIDEDGPCAGDLWFASVDEALQCAQEEYGVAPDAWQQVADPLEHCQDDLLAPVRVVGRDIGNPQWGKLERLENNSWVPYSGFSAIRSPEDDVC